MAIDGSVSHGDGDRIILGELEEHNFRLDFKEYVLKEELKWSRYEVVRFRVPYFGWVFWSQKDHEIERSVSRDNSANFNPNICAIPKVRDNIGHALQKIIVDKCFEACLVQFWAPTTTLEGRTLVATKYQPFALGTTYTTTERQWLCEYRMKMCREYNFFYGDAKSGEEQLGLPGRVFLHKFPESTPNVEYYSIKEYPQRNLSLLCQIRESWAVPVFEHSSQTCVGVLEMVSLFHRSSVWHDKYFLRRMYDIFQVFGLQCFDGYKICEMQVIGAYKYFDVKILSKQSRERIKRKKGLTRAFQELNSVLRLVCEIHGLPLAMTWVPCSACDGLLQGQLWCKDGISTGVEFCADINSPLTDFLKVGKCSHLRKGLVAVRALSSPNMLYCSDITQLSVDEYPLVPYARQCKLSGWFTICLQNIYTGNDIYVLEFFLSARSKDDENILTTLSFILGTMEKNFKTFRLASGIELGELMSIEVIYFHNDHKIHSVEMIQATRDFSSLSSDLSSEQSSASVSNTRSGFQDVFAKYASTGIVFKMSLLCRLVELQQEVAKRLNLKAGTFHVGYEDEEDGFVLIACDEDLQDYIDDSISQGNTSPVILLKPKEPANPTD